MKNNTNFNSSSSFCILPWIHSSILPNGDVYPCEHSTSSIGGEEQSLKNYTLAEIQNGKVFTSIRNKMCQGQEVNSCEKCYLIENSGGKSLRIQANEDFKDHLESVTKCGPTIFFKMVSFDIRASNVCNLQCRICNPKFSSALNDEFVEIYSFDKQKFLQEHFKGWSEILSLIKNEWSSIERIYFAGGEPLLHNEQYEILEFLIEKHHFDLQINYNSNCTTLQFRNKNILKLWNQFKHVAVWCSIDAIGIRAEYLRKGSNWNLIEKNLRYIQIMSPHVRLILAPTISILNIFHLLDLIDYFLEKKLILNASFIRFNILQLPNYYHIGILSLSDKNKLRERFEKYIFNMECNKVDGVSYLKKEFEVLNAILMNSDFISKQNEFKAVTQKTDQYRKENMCDILPELKFLFEKSDKA